MQIRLNQELVAIVAAQFVLLSGGRSRPTVQRDVELSRS
jgi:hypothetical protein